MQIVNHL